MTPFFRLAAPALALSLLSGCVLGGNAVLYPLETPTGTETAQRRLYVSSIEVRDVLVPAYAEDSQMQYRGPDGGLVPLPDAQWAAPTGAAITAELARALDLASTASVAADPWPLSDRAAVQLQVRIDRLILNHDGRFEMGGQFAVASVDEVVREFIDRFEITSVVAEMPASPSALAAAYGDALAQLRDRILTRLSRSPHRPRKHTAPRPSGSRRRSRFARCLSGSEGPAARSARRPAAAA